MSGTRDLLALGQHQSPILRNALERAARDGRDRVTTTIVDRVRPDAERDVLRSNLSSLSREQRVFLETVADVGPSTSGSIYDAHCACVDDAKSKQAVRDWLSKMHHYGLVEYEGPANAREYRVAEHVLEMV